MVRRNRRQRLWIWLRNPFNPFLPCRWVYSDWSNVSPIQRDRTIKEREKQRKDSYRTWLAVVSAAVGVVASVVRLFR